MREFDLHLANKRPFVSDMNKPILYHFMDDHYKQMRLDYNVENLFKEDEYLSSNVDMPIRKKAKSTLDSMLLSQKPPRYKCSLPFV